MTEARAERSIDLDAALTAKLAWRLVSEWESFNWSLFGNAMRKPVFQLVDSREHLGRWSRNDRTLMLSRTGVLTRPWVETLETLKHEMAHQYVDEVIGGEHEPHGPLFRRVCQARGIDPAAVAPREPKDATPRSEDRVIARVRKLLALAESSNQHEAELAAATAQRIMLKFNIEIDRGPESERPQCTSLWLGAPKGRVQAHERVLADILVQHFFVQVIWIQVYRPLEGKNGSVLEACGRPENLQMAEFVHAFLLGTTERLWLEHKRAHGLRSNRDRLSFLAGAMAGFAAKLDAQREHARREGLVWIGEAAAAAYLKRRYPRTRTTSSTDRSDRSGYAEGQSAGRGIVLSRPVSSSASEGPRRALRAADRGES